MVACLRKVQMSFQLFFVPAFCLHTLNCQKGPCKTVTNSLWRVKLNISRQEEGRKEKTERDRERQRDREKRETRKERKRDERGAVVLSLKHKKKLLPTHLKLTYLTLSVGSSLFLHFFF